jgi:hypothetical protein
MAKAATKTATKTATKAKGKALANRSAVVDQFLAQLKHPLKAEVARVREIILGANPAITEQIKWRAPSFCINGDDRVTFRLQPPRDVQLIFHRGAKVKDTTGFSFTDESGLMTWLAPDRATVSFQDMAEIEASRAALAALVDRWVKATA